MTITVKKIESCVKNVLTANTQFATKIYFSVYYNCCEIRKTQKYFIFKEVHSF